jgi:hypothetical protein
MIKEQGIDQFECSIIYQNTNVEDAFWYEQDVIKKHRSDPLLLNRQYRDRLTSKGMFLFVNRRPEAVTERIKKTRLEKYGTLSSIRPGSIEKMIATRKARDNYKHNSDFAGKMLSTKKLNGTMNSNTPESRAKSRQTKLERYGCVQPKHTPETIKKLKGPKSPDHVAKVLATKKKNGTLNSNTHETIAQRKQTLLEKWGTLNTREISKLKKSRGEK